MVAVDSMAGCITSFKSLKEIRAAKAKFFIVLHNHNCRELEYIHHSCSHSPIYHLTPDVMTYTKMCLLSSLIGKQDYEYCTRMLLSICMHKHSSQLQLSMFTM